MNLCECGHLQSRHGGLGGPCASCGCQGFATQAPPPVRRSFISLEAAYDYAAGAAAVQLKRWLVCRRAGKWFAIEPGMAGAVRSNPNWPGRPQ